MQNVIQRVRDYAQNQIADWGINEIVEKNKQ